jgi:archaellum component FlaC
MIDDIVALLREGADYEHDTVVMEEAADEIERLRAYFDAHAATIQKQSDEITRLRAALKPLVDVVELMRDSSAFVEHQRAHRVTSSMWQALCRQVKTARAALAPAQETSHG